MKLTKTQIAELKSFPFGPARIGASKELCEWINKILVLINMQELEIEFYKEASVEK